MILDLSRLLGYDVIAEGIETEKELAAMKGIGIFIVQGYLLGRPGDDPSARSVDLEALLAPAEGPGAGVLGDGPGRRPTTAPSGA